jgi:outer membrane protein insertion porin family
VTLVLGVLSAAELLAQEDFSTELTRVDRVRIEGRSSVPAKDLWAVIKTEKPSLMPWSDRPVLRRDFLRSDTLAIVAVYRRHGFLDARAGVRVEETEREDRVAVTFMVHEGPRSYVRKIEIVGTGDYPADDLQKKLLTRVGKPFNPTSVFADTARISREYQERGHIPIVNAYMWRDTTAVGVRYQIEPGPRYTFGEVYLSVAGESNVDERLVRRELLIKEGEPYRLSRVELTAERLSQTGYFRSFQLDRLVDSSRTVVEWDLRLSERKPRWLDAGVGSGTTERFRFTGEWGHRNMAGAGLQGVVASRFAFDGEGNFLLARGEVSLTEPWLFSTRTRGTITPYYERSHDYADPTFVLEQQRRGLTLRARRDFGTSRLGRAVRISLTQDNVFVDQEVDFRDPTLSDSARQAILSATTPSYNTHLLQLAVDRDRRNDIFNPTRGSAQAVYGEIAGGPLQGSSNFLKGEMGSAWYTPFRGWIVATRMRGGATDPFGSGGNFTPTPGLDKRVQLVPLEDRFRLGGVNTIRGFNENSIPASGGLALLLANVELRIPLAGPFGIEAYVDAGNVWDRPTYIKGDDLLPSFDDTPRDPGETVWVYGFGPRLILPFGPLRVDFTWDFRPDLEGERYRGAQFAIGPSF